MCHPTDSLSAPLPSQTLSFGDLRGRHLGGDDVSILDGLGVSADTRAIVPHVRLYIVLPEALAIVIFEGEVELRVRISLIRSQPIPANSLRVVLRAPWPLLYMKPR
jgi:hypothetical protein